VVTLRRVQVNLFDLNDFIQIKIMLGKIELRLVATRGHRRLSLFRIGPIRDTVPISSVNNVLCLSWRVPIKLAFRMLRLASLLCLRNFIVATTTMNG